MLASYLSNSAVACFSVFVTCLAPIAASRGEQYPDLSSEEWLSAEAVYAATLHAVAATEKGFVARNLGQVWLTSFDRRGFLIEPDASDWTWGLELVSYGFAEAEQFVGDFACASAEGGRVTYSWDGRLDEWYVNDTRGFEHGFTVHERPTRANDEAAGPLAFELQLRGDLTPVVQEGRRGVSFLDSQGAVALTYSGLTAFDANGQTLRSWIELSSAGFSLKVDERDACYPLTIDPVAQQAYLKASNPGAFDFFGQAVAISGDTVVIGAPFEDSNATGVNGDGANALAFGSGAAYVFVRDGSTWSQQAFLKASNTETDDDFGFSVAVSGDTVVVGAKWEDSGATGVDGDQVSNGALESGAAYVFVRSGTTWSQQAYLKASNTDPFDGFGESVAITGNTIVVGAIFEQSNASGVNGIESNNSLFGAGAAYVFARSGTTWGQQAYLKASNPNSADHFGWSVSISGSTVVVGARGEDSVASGIDGDQADNSASNSGAAYAFVRSGSNWIQQAYLKASNTDPGDLFGVSVSVSGNTIVVGACDEQGGAVGINGSESSNSTLSAGAAYAFTRSGSVWSQEAYIKASNTGSEDLFAWSLALSGDDLIVGARGESSNATGTGGSQANNDAPSAGAAFAFVRTGTVWAQTDYFKALNTEASDNFGYAVALSGETVLVGASGEGGSATGVNGDGALNGAPQAGAAYVFGLRGFFVSFCSGDGGNQMGCTNCPCGNSAPINTLGGCINSAGGSARLEASGDPSVSLPAMSGADLRFGIFGVPPNAFCILNSGDSVAPGNMAHPCFGMNSGSQAAAFDGLRCAIMNTRRHGGRSADLNGSVGVTNNPWGGEGGPPVGFAVAGGGFAAGQTRYFQVINRDEPLAVCMRGLNTSQAIGVTFEP